MVSNLDLKSRLAGLERRVGELLDEIPGYRGYRAKEDRRDADRRVREHVAARYEREAERVERVAKQLADARRLEGIQAVDEFAQTLRRFVDKVRTATYGYGGLFGDRDVDAAALDQLRLFDEGLLDGIDELNKPIADLETAARGNGDLAAPAQAGSAVARKLLDRFALREEVIETAQPAAEARVLDVLKGEAKAPPAQLLSLGVGEAVSVLGDDYLTDAGVEVDGRPASFRLVRLQPSPEEWLFVPAAGVDWFARLQPAAAGALDTEGGDAAFREEAAGSGDGNVSGRGGSGARPVRFRLLTGVQDPDARGVHLDWGTEEQTLVGTVVEPEVIDVYGKPASAADTDAGTGSGGALG